MGSKTTKLQAKDTILGQILELIYNIDRTQLVTAYVTNKDDILAIEADIMDSNGNMIHKVFNQDDGSITDMLFNIMNNDSIIFNPYEELEESVKKYNDHVRLMKALEKQGLY